MLFNFHMIPWYHDKCRSHGSFLVNELVKAQWTLFCGKVTVCGQFTGILYTSTLEMLPRGPLHLSLVQPATANHHGEMILLSFCGQRFNQKNVFMLPFRAECCWATAGFRKSFQHHCNRRSKNEVGEGSSGRRQRGEIGRRGGRDKGVWAGTHLLHHWWMAGVRVNLTAICMFRDPACLLIQQTHSFPSISRSYLFFSK